MAALIDGLGGATGYGENSFKSAPKVAGNNDDGSVAVDVTSVFGPDGLNFGGTNYTNIYINSNGIITFDGPETSPNPVSVGSYTSPIIAPFWGDINIDGGGEILWDLDPANGQMIITWLDVTPYSGSGYNSFQVVLTDAGGGDFEIQMNYKDIQWAGNAEGGISDGGSNDFVLTGSPTSWDNKNWQPNNFDTNNDKGIYQINVSDGVPVDHSIEPDGVVDGGSGDDNFSIGLGDLVGDVITNAADLVRVGGGNDTVDAGDGDDTIHGGEGSDSITGGLGADIIYGEGDAGDETTTGTTQTINVSNYWDTSSGFTVTARNVEYGSLTTASVNNITTYGGDFGSDGSVSDTDSGMHEQIGFDKASGLSEQLIVDFDNDLDELSFTFSSLWTHYYGEQAQWTIYNNGVQVAQDSFTEIGSGSGSGTIDLSGYGAFDRIIFSSLMQTDGTDGSDYLISSITYTQADVLSYDDTIDGGSGADTIYGGVGNDSLLGDIGDDYVEAGDGDDIVSGGVGGDTILGGDGDDYIDGGEGDDLLKTGLGQDTLVGGEGDDTLMNSWGDDSLVGGIGDDSIIATAGADTLEGGDGDDTLDGGSDNDSLVGGAGDDVLYTGLGDDVAFGGDDADTFHVHGAEGIQFNQTGTDGVVAATNISDFPTDKLSFEIQFSSDGTGPTEPTFASYAVSGTDNEFLVYSNSSDQLLVGIGGSVLNTGASVAGLFDNTPHSLAVTWDSATGALDIYADGVSVYSGTHATGDTLTQGGTFVFGQDQDSLGGGFNPTQRFQGQIHNAKLYDDLRTPAEIATESVTHEGDTSNPNLIAGWVPDADTGGMRDLTANHPMTPSGDAQVVTGLGGNDTITGGEGGTDSDTIDLSALTSPVTVTYTGDEAGTITDGTDTITFSEIENLILTDGDDSVYGAADSAGLNIDGGAGDDTIEGGYNDDSIVGGTGDDVLDGRDGKDTLDGGDGNDTLYASFDDGTGDVFIGGAGIDTHQIDGSDTQNFAYDVNLTTGIDQYGNTFSGIENVIGGKAADTLTGDSNDNVLDGNDGADRFVALDNFGNDTIVGGEGGTDSDTIDLSALTSPVTVTYTGDEAGTITDGTDTITFSEIENLVLTDGADSVDGSSDAVGLKVFARDGDDTVSGGTGADTVDGGTGADSISTGDGNDSITGGVGDDTITGGTGNDYIAAGDGNDSIVGSGEDGNDTILGQDGDDWIDAGNHQDSVEGGSGNDTIKSDWGSNTLDGGSGNDLIHGGGHGDTIIGGTGSDTIYGDFAPGDTYYETSWHGNDSISAGDGDDFVEAGGGNDTVDGGSGQDSIDGGAGNDSLTGGAGDDIFSYSVGEGHDTISDFNTGNSGTLTDGDSTNNDFIDLSGFYDNLSELYADQADDGILNQSNTSDTKGRSVDYSDNSEFGAGDSLTFQGASANNSSFREENTGVVCFTAGTAIRTPRGDFQIDDLRVGDLVNTLDNGPQRIRWISRRRLSQAELQGDLRLRPILIRRGLMGAERDLLVSRQHCLLGDRDTLVRAGHLADQPGSGIRIAHGKRQIEYIHLMFDAHQIIFANGVAAESFYPGPHGFESFEQAKQAAFLDEFPEYIGAVTDMAKVQVAYGPTCRPILTGAEVKSHQRPLQRRFELRP